MNVASSPVSQIDLDTNKRQALAKVYKLLLNLAQEVKGNIASSGISSTNGEKIIETASFPEATPSQ
jgi:hypothetical protein